MRLHTAFLSAFAIEKKQKKRPAYSDGKFIKAESLHDTFRFFVACDRSCRVIYKGRGNAARQQTA